MNKSINNYNEGSSDEKFEQHSAELRKEKFRLPSINEISMSIWTELRLHEKI